MNKFIIYTIFVIATLTTGCNKYLDVEPDNRTQLNSVDKIAQLLASAYPRGNYQAFAEASSDNVGDRESGDALNISMDPYMFRDVRDNAEDSPEFYWNACYEAIASANIALDAIAKQPDAAKYQPYKGEALVCRAYAHFMLATFFAKVYDPATAATDLGIPYVKEVENVVIKQYSRRTVAYVYEMIEKDLVAGLPLIKDEAYSVPAYHFNTLAANAFAARFYLFKRDYPKVLQYANDVIPANNPISRLRPWNTVYATPTGGLTRLQLWAVYAKATTPANLLLCETSSAYLREYALGRFGYTTQNFREIGIYIPVLGNTVNVLWAASNQTYGGDNLAYIPKMDEYFVRASVNAEIGDAYIMLPAFTAEEALFNKAEALTYLGSTGDAITLLNQFLSTRIYNYNAANTNHQLTAAKITAAYGVTIQQGLINTILDLKQGEFIHEGMRWFDILRYNIPVVHYMLGNNEPFELTANDKRKVFQLPQSTSLSGLEPNPR